jgi:hypothetical protein
MLGRDAALVTQDGIKGLNHSEQRLGVEGDAYRQGRHSTEASARLAVGAKAVAEFGHE